MSDISISKDIVPIGEFKTSLSKWLKSVQETGHPVVITQNGRPAGVLLSPSEYDELQYRKAFLASVERGLADTEAERVLDSTALRKELEKRRKAERRK